MTNEWRPAYIVILNYRNSDRMPILRILTGWSDFVLVANRMVRYRTVAITKKTGNVLMDGTVKLAKKEDIFPTAQEAEAAASELAKKVQMAVQHWVQEEA